MFNPKIIVVHASGTADDGAVSWLAIRHYQMSWRVDRVIVTEEEWCRRKAAKQGSFFETPWMDIGYHAGAEWIKAGDLMTVEVMMGRMWDIQGAHCLGHNHEALGFCFVGVYKVKSPHEQMLLAGAKVLRLWMKLFGIPKEKIFAHRQLEQTDCPGVAFDINHLLSMV